ncbi:MAG: flagellin, partial [Thermogutta sp.]
MTRINTNVSSLTAQKTLSRSQAKLQEALTRLSTGLRINVGKDDPAGLIASETLRSDITSIQRAISNSERASQMIATADSALGQISQLLNDIRGLVSEAANKGAMSAEQIAANQLQIDSSLEAIDRIAQVTQFQGRRLLDGSLDFVTNGVDNSIIRDLQIDQANFGANNEIAVNVTVVRQATRAELRYRFGAVANDVVLEVGGKQGFEAFSFAAGSSVEDMARAINLVSDATGVVAELQREATAGQLITSSYGANNDIVITANQAGEAPGDIRVKYTKSSSATTNVIYTPTTGRDPGLIEVQLGTRQWEAASGVLDP